MAAEMAYIGAGIAIGLTGLASGIAEKDVGAAAVGAITEDVSLFGKAVEMSCSPSKSAIVRATLIMRS